MHDRIKILSDTREGLAKYDTRFLNPAGVGVILIDMLAKLEGYEWIAEGFIKKKE